MEPTPNRPVPAVGLHPGVPFGTYCSWDAANFHTVMHYGRSAMHARHKMIFGETETQPLVLGDACHAAILQPAVFDAQYVAMPDFGDGRTKAAKEAKAAFMASMPPNAICITDTEYRNAVGMREALKKLALTNALLFTSQGMNELSFAWDQQGIRCKGRIDRLCSHDGRSLIVDLKTSRQPWEADFPKDAGRYEYRTQLASYRTGLNTLSPINRGACIIAVESEAPFEPCVYWIPDKDLDRDSKKYARWLDMHGKCTKAGSWPPANIHGLELVLPRWKDRESGNLE